MYIFYKRLGLNNKGAISVLCGISLGITLSLVLAPIVDETCPPKKLAENLKQSSDSPSVPPRKPLNDRLGSDYNDVGDDFEPRIRTLTNPPITDINKERKKPLRPRYASTELGIHEKLLVGVLTSRNTIDTFGVAVNITLWQFVTKLIFFMDTRGPKLPNGMAVVSFSDEKPHMKPFHVFKYIEDHYLKNYDWFFFVTDDTYIRGLQLFEMLSNMSVGKDVCMGIASEANYCKLENGILLSQVGWSWFYIYVIKGKNKSQCI